MSERRNLTPLPTTTDVEPYLTAEQIAPLLGLTPKTVLRHAWNGELPSHRISSRSVRFLWSEVDASIRSRCTRDAAGRAAS